MASPLSSLESRSFAYWLFERVPLDAPLDTNGRSVLIESFFPCRGTRRTFCSHSAMNEWLDGVVLRQHPRFNDVNIYELASYCLDVGVVASRFLKLGFRSKIMG